VPPAWSVTYRYVIATAAMFLSAALMRVPLGIGRAGHLLALPSASPQFVLNFNFVYAAEQHITSGIVAVVFALLLVPNSSPCLAVPEAPGHGSLPARIGRRNGRRRPSFLNELRNSPASPREVGIGIGLTLLGVLAASVSNVMQASSRFREHRWSRC
jgi:hypothetical protein